MTLRPSRFYLWIGPIICLAVAGVFLSIAYQSLVHRGPGEAWLVAAFDGGMIAVAVLARKVYIRADDSTLTFGPKLPLPIRRTFDRREVARIRATPSPITRRTLFLRSDGSTLWSTSGFFWGRDGLQSLADYLGVPFEGWGSYPN